MRLARFAILTTLALALLAAPLAVGAQQAGKVPRIGILRTSTPNDAGVSGLWEAFFLGLRDLGYLEGQNVIIERRSDAAGLALLPVDVIVAGTAPAPEMARRATSTIPIVMTNHADPVGSGLVASLAKPGGNVTGLSFLSPEVRSKQLQLLKETVPTLSRVAILANPANPTDAFVVKEMEVAARSLKVRLQVLEVRAPGEFAGAFSGATRERAGALIVLGNVMFFNQRARLVELAARSRLPAMYGVRDYAEAGGLMVYNANLRDSFRRAATYVDKILKGAKPADLPIEQPTKFELVINLKTAKASGLTIPPSVLARADEVIQ